MYISLNDSGGTVYIVKSGDTLANIAAKYGVSIWDIQKVNPAITNVNLIYVGQKINIPSASGSATNNVVGQAVAPVAKKDIWSNAGTAIGNVWSWLSKPQDTPIKYTPPSFFPAAPPPKPSKLPIIIASVVGVAAIGGLLFWKFK